MNKRLVLSFSLVFCFSVLSAQDNIDWEKEFEKLEAEMDSLSIFYIFDSVLSASPIKYSQINTGLSYNSNLSNSSSDISTNFKYLSPSVSYYHSNGLYSDISVYLNTDSSFQYSQSIITAGYMLGKKNFSIIPYYSLWLYHDQSREPRHNTGTNVSYHNKFGYVSLRYSYFFGNESTHRLIATIGGTINLGKTWFFDKVKIIPFASAYYGNSDVYSSFSWDQTSEKTDALNTIYSDTSFLFSAMSLLSLEDRRQIFRIENADLSAEEKVASLSEIYQNYDAISNYVQSDFSLGNYSNKFGFLNYSFSIPIVLQYKSLSTILSYTYSIPKSLPGEGYSENASSYFGISFSYRIPLKIK